MMVMPSNNSGIQVGYLCGKFPGRLGWLVSPDGWRRPPTWMPYALDNGAFGAWLHKREWDESAFWALLEKSARVQDPVWIVVPDVVADRRGTLDRWMAWAPRIRGFRAHWKLAFAVQDGMTARDVPSDADVVFVGGTTEWKWRHLRTWTENFARVHVARVNSERMLWMAHDAGAESCDGTGWLRGDPDQLAGLERYLERSSTNKPRAQMVMEAVCP